MNNKKIGLFIASLRKDKNMTQKEIADKLYISDKAVSKWERGLSIPDIGIIEKLSEYLEVSVSEILKGEKIDNTINVTSDETTKTGDSFFKKLYSKNKIIFLVLTLISLIIVLGIILYIIGTVDYIRSMNGKKPLFIYHTVNVFNSDVYKEVTEYYGIGYKISLCDNQKNNYIFQLGQKQKKVCYTNLTCTEDERGTLTMIDENTVAYVENDKHSYEFSFYDDILYLIKSTFLIPTSYIEDEETWATEKLKYYDVDGINISIKKINQTTYEMKQSCNIPIILKNGNVNICSIDYHDTNIFGLTKDDIVSYYHKDACK